MQKRAEAQLGGGTHEWTLYNFCKTKVGSRKCDIKYVYNSDDDIIETMKQPNYKNINSNEVFVCMNTS